MNVESVTLEIIDSTRYRKLTPFRYSLYVFLFVAAYSTIKPFGRPSITDYLSINNIIVYVLIILLIIPGIWLYFYSKNYQILGSLNLSSETVTISFENMPSAIYPIIDLIDFAISRGSTVHHIEDNAYPPETNDNWISFRFNNTNYKYEFAILNVEENTAFERMINEWRGRYDSFYYESI